ncbi:hypothetical protein V500_02786 [Pseudogymnoascus sp. VKM F-4518 (FW-2643)]|nr:hypothetical protein V500_02786 [Pseudogymnoascus sp. VKM F-4518 (FW-2643)]
MAAATLESLPAEILLHICEYLERDYMSSVSAFARASKYCYFALTALLFRTIKFDVSTRLQLSTDVQECSNMLQRAASFGHVRRLVLDSQPPKADDVLDRHNQWHRPAITAEERGYSDEIFYKLNGSRLSFYETVGDWEPLANLVEQLPSLADLIFGWLQYDEMGGMAYGNPNYEREALMRLVTGLAPNLKEVHMFHRSEGLQFLRLSTYEDTTSQLVKDWRASTDFSVLRSLKLESVMQEDAAEFLSTNCSFPSLTNLYLKLGARYYMDPSPTKEYFDAANRFLCSLPHLNTLSLVGDIPQITLDTALGHHGSSLHKLLLSRQQVTGDRLQRHIADIREYCPLLEDLSLSIPRSRGDATEVAAYKTLGSIPRLQRLSLGLDASDFAVLYEDDDNDDEEPTIPNDPTFDEFDQEFFTESFGAYYRKPRNGHIRDALINSALDEPLARESFGAIVSGKPDGALPLEELEVRTYGGCQFTHRQGQLLLITTVIDSLSRQWLVKRNPRDDSRQELVVKELGGETGADNTPLDSMIEPIFRKIWPAKHNEGGNNWRDDWNSWPLFKSDT